MLSINRLPVLIVIRILRRKELNDDLKQRLLYFC